MGVGYLMACGIVWSKSADRDAGLVLINALGDMDPELRILAHQLLVSAGEISIPLVESAIAIGTLDAADGSQCLLELLARKAQTSYQANSPDSLAYSNAN